MKCTKYFPEQLEVGYETASQQTVSAEKESKTQPEGKKTLILENHLLTHV